VITDNIKRKGLFFVIEGTDGSGGATQTRRLVEKFLDLGYEVEQISFPQYGKPSSAMLEAYLGGEYGKDPKTINAKAASIFFAIDRFDASFQIKEWIDAGKIVISDRYVGSNMGHQGSKISDPEERRKYLDWNDDLEHGIFGIPRPDLNIVLSVTLEYSIKLAALGAKDKVKVKGDIHEGDSEHLKASIDTYCEIAQNYPNFKLIECVEDGELLSIDTIHEKIWREIEEVVPHGIVLKQEVKI